MDIELWVTWKKVTIACLMQDLLCLSLEGIRRTTENFSQDIRSPGTIFIILTFPEYVDWRNLLTVGAEPFLEIKHDLWEGMCTEEYKLVHMAPRVLKFPASSGDGIENEEIWMLWRTWSLSNKLQMAVQDGEFSRTTHICYTKQVRCRIVKA
jgi:hypothetical protein